MVNKTFIIGVDIGLKGAITILNSKGKFINCYKMPIIKEKTKNKIDVEKLTNILKQYPNSILCCEKLSAMPGQGVSSMFKLGYNAGIIVGISNALMKETIEISPKRWQNFLSRNFIIEYKDIKDKTYKEFIDHITNLKSVKISKINSAYLYYAINNKQLNCIKYKDDNIVDSFLIAYYCFLIKNK